MRADGITVGEAINREAAFLRSLGYDVKDGGLPFDEAKEEFRDKMRKAVLDAMDECAESLTKNREDGPKDQELPALFRGVDAIADRVFLKSYGL